MLSSVVGPKPSILWEHSSFEAVAGQWYRDQVAEQLLVHVGLGQEGNHQQLLLPQ